MPLRSLAGSFYNAHQRLEALPDEQREAYHISPVVTPDPPLPIEPSDLGNLDTVHKHFQWVFKPKGSGKEIEQSIDLALSRSRFEYYRRQPRLSRQWNLYAELEMPEVRDLACAFQQLHAQHHWSTFNQACNVLKFVQSCIPYSYDRDTTGHEDWARYPIETLMEGTGDCEDVAILCAAVIARLGFQVVLLLYPQHLAFGVAGANALKGEYIEDTKSGMRYFYGEATADGWHLGEIPKAYSNLSPEELILVNILLNEQEEMEG